MINLDRGEMFIFGNRKAGHLYIHARAKQSAPSVDSYQYSIVPCGEASLKSQATQSEIETF